MHVKELMSSPVIVTTRDTQIKHIRDKFNRKNVNAIPVLEQDGNIAGILSSSDVAKEHSDEKTAEDLMTDHVHIVMPTNRVQDAAKTMLKHGIHHLVVMEEGNVVGMVSSLDLLGALLPE